MKKIFAGFLCLTALYVSGEEFSSGGTIYDFSKMTPKAAPVADKSKSVLVNGSFEEPGTDFLPGKKRYGKWRGNLNIHGKTPHRDKILALCSRTVTSEKAADGKKSVCLNTPGEVVKLIPKLVISNRIVQEIMIPETKEDTVWELRFRMRGHHLPSYGSSAVNVLYAPLKMLPGKRPRLVPFKGYKTKSFTLRPEWSDGSVTIKAPAGTRGFYICPALYGTGTAWLDDFTLIRSTRGTAVEVRVSPQGFMDNVFVMGEDLPGMISFAFAADRAPKRRDLFLEVILPRGFQALGTREFVPLRSRTKNPDGTTRVLIELRWLPPIAFTRKFFKMHAAVLVMKAPGIKAGTGRYPLRYRLVQGKWQGKQHTIDLQIIPAVHGKRPKHFRSAAMLGMGSRFKGEMAKIFAGFYRTTGFSAVHGAQQDLAAELKKIGIERYRGHYYICNGFRIGKGKHPEFAQFKLIDGKPYPRKICPVEVYREGKFFKENVVKLIEDLIVKEDAAEHIMSNWEPYYLNSKGCFCLRCRDEFIKWSNGAPSAAEIKAAWPKNTFQRHGGKWIRFRSWQHGRLMVTLEKTTRAAGRKVGKESHFIPEISWSSMTPQMNFWSKQYNVTDYISELPWLEPWGPYNAWYWDTPYNYYPAPHLSTWLAAEQVRNFAKSKAKPGKMPKLIAFPHGRMGDTTVSHPEALAFEMLCFFLKRWNGAFFFTFPSGYDYRYWAWTARANTLVAEHEDMVMNGKDVTAQLKIVPRSPYPKELDFMPALAEPTPGSGKLPGLHKQKIFQFRAFMRNGEYLAAVGNFWKKGELFYLLKLSGLKGGKWHVSVGKYDLGSYSAEELSRGILLQTGALRWQFIRISLRKKAGLIPFTQGQMRALFKKRLPAVRKAARFEEKLHSSRQAAERVDMKGVKAVSSNKVNVAPQGDNMLVKTPVFQAVVSLKQGGRISSLKSKGEELVGTKSNLHWFAVPGVWYPRKSTFMLNSVMELQTLKAVPGGVRLILSRKLTPRDQQNLAGAVLEMQYDFLPGQINMTGRIINKTHDALEYAFRFHAMPAVLGKKGDISGSAVWKDKTQFRREFVVQLYHYGPKDPLMSGKEFSISAAKPVRSREVTLGTPYLKRKMHITLPENVRQIVFWDSASQDNSTFEVIYDRKILHPGARAEYSMSVRID